MSIYCGEKTSCRHSGPSPVRGPCRAWSSAPVRARARVSGFSATETWAGTACSCSCFCSWTSIYSVEHRRVPAYILGPARSAPPPRGPAGAWEGAPAPRRTALGQRGALPTCVLRALGPSYNIAAITSYGCTRMRHKDQRPRGGVPDRALSSQAFCPHMPQRAGKYVRTTASHTFTYKGHRYRFRTCCASCASVISGSPSRYIVTGSRCHAPTGSLCLKHQQTGRIVQYAHRVAHRHRRRGGARCTRRRVGRVRRRSGRHRTARR